MKVSDRRESGPAPGSSSALARGSLLKSIKLASFGLLPGSQTERCSFSKRSAISVPTTVLTKREYTSQWFCNHILIKVVCILWHIHKNVLYVIYYQIALQSYPILSTKQHNKVPQQSGRVPVQEIIVTCALQCFVLGELYDIHLMGLLPNGQDTRLGTCKLSHIMPETFLLHLPNKRTREGS